MRHASQKVILSQEGFLQFNILLLQFDILFFQGLLKVFPLGTEPAYNDRAQHERDQIRHLSPIDSEAMEWRYEEIGDCCHRKKGRRQARPSSAEPGAGHNRG